MSFLLPQDRISTTELGSIGTGRAGRELASRAARPEQQTQPPPSGAELVEAKMKHIAAYLLVSDQGAVSSQPPAYLVATLSHLPPPLPAVLFFARDGGKGRSPSRKVRAGAGARRGSCGARSCLQHRVLLPAGRPLLPPIRVPRVGRHDTATTQHPGRGKHGRISLWNLKD